MMRTRIATMSSGVMTATVNLQTPSGTSGEGYVTVWSGVPANIRSASGSELLRFGAQIAVNTVVITMRYRTDLKSDWRITWPSEARAFQITGYADTDGDRRWLTVFCTEIQ